MLGEFLTATLTLLFGYAYPAFECFKMVEKRPGHVEQLRFWCQYCFLFLGLLLQWCWYLKAPSHCNAKLPIIKSVSLFQLIISFTLTSLSIIEHRLPMYGEVKLAFFVYLWYPKTKYEPNIEQRLGNLRAKSGQVLVFYIKNFTDKGMTFFLEVVHQVVSPPPNREHIRHEDKKQTGWSPFPVKRSMYNEPKTPDCSDVDAAIVKPLRNAPATARAKPKRPHYLTSTRR
ncbi:putative HVA22-like protein g isoform X2 [Carex rostrata]